MLYVFYLFHWKYRQEWYNEHQYINNKNYYYTHANVDFRDTNGTLPVEPDVYLIWCHERNIYERFV